MQGSARFATASLIGLTILSFLLVPLANAAQWVGNDNQEFETNGIPSYVRVDEFFSLDMSWSSSPPRNWVSLQYNPDWDYSKLYNGWPNGRWVQPSIYSDRSGCVGFTVQIYDQINIPPIWRDDYPYSAGCVTIDGSLGQYAWWEIGENVFSDGTIKEIYLQVDGSNGYSGLLSVPPNGNKWLRSNICWCGTGNVINPGDGFATFTTAGGTSYVTSDKNIVLIAPPSDTSTKENSNMQYGCFTLTNDPRYVTQSFGLSGHC